MHGHLLTLLRSFQAICILNAVQIVVAMPIESVFAFIIVSGTDIAAPPRALEKEEIPAGSPRRVSAFSAVRRKMNPEIVLYILAFA